MNKFLFLLMLSVTFLFASIDLNTATKSELMKIKGIGAKKAEKIITFRKSNQITNVDDLKNLKGFGPSLIKNIKIAVEVK